VVHLVTYDLVGQYRPPADYAAIEDAIKSIGPWCHLQKSVWLVESELLDSDLAARLRPYTYLPDKLWVCRIYRSWSGYNLDEDQQAWLNSRNFGSLAETLSAFLPSPFNVLGKLGR